MKESKSKLKMENKENNINNEILHKEIDLIQSIIARMANNSFLLKGWMISLVAAILVLSKDTVIVDDLRYLSLILCLPVIAFWYLDAFFLHKEKCYRKLYKWIIKNRQNTTEHLYSLSYSRFSNQVECQFAIMFSKTLWPFYGITFGILIAITIYNFSWLLGKIAEKTWQKSSPTLLQSRNW